MLDMYVNKLRRNFFQGIFRLSKLLYFVKFDFPEQFHDYFQLK